MYIYISILMFRQESRVDPNRLRLFTPFCATRPSRTRLGRANWPFARRSSKHGVQTNTPSTYARQKVVRQGLRSGLEKRFSTISGRFWNQIWSGRDLASILVASARYQALPGALSGVPARPLGLSGRSWGVSGTARDTPETPPERSWAAWGAPKGSQDRFSFFCVAPATPFDKQPYFV